MGRPSRSDWSRRAVLGAGAALAAPAAARGRPVVLACCGAAGALGEMDVTAGASGVLAEAVAGGARADAVVLAATDWMAWLAGLGAVGSARVVGHDRLVRVPGRGLVTGDPDVSALGRHAQGALEGGGAWPGVRLVPCAADVVAAARRGAGAVAYGSMIDGAPVEGPPVRYVAALVDGRAGLLDRIAAAGIGRG